jgi:hypothetical protein
VTALPSGVTAIPPTAIAVSEDDTGDTIVVKAYFVGDLIEATKFQNSFQASDATKLGAFAILIQRTVLPETWNEKTTFMQPYFNAQSLVIQQSESVHEQIAEMLLRMRKTYNIFVEEDELPVEMPMEPPIESTPIAFIYDVADLAAISNNGMRELSTIIQGTITPDAWDKSVRMEEVGMKLVIAHLPEEHERIKELLRQLRSMVERGKVPYRLGPGDTLGIYIETITGRPGEPIPVHLDRSRFPAPPTMGYPFTISENGTLTLPKIRNPLMVKGLTLSETQSLIYWTYVVNQKIVEPDAVILVSLIYPNVEVIVDKPPLQAD